MYNESSFWKASINELKKGFITEEQGGDYICLICGKRFEQDMIYPSGSVLYNAHGAVQAHIAEAHVSMFEYFLGMGKTYTSLTDHQKELMRLFYSGLSDKEIVKKTSASSVSTIRNQRFTLKEKYKQAKIITAMMELLDEKRESIKEENPDGEARISGEALVDIHRYAASIDERYAITQSEKDEIISRYFDKDNKLIIKELPVKEKRKIIILQHIMRNFEYNRTYSEKEINAVIKEIYADFVTIRRYLIEYGFLDRTLDGRLYWIKTAEAFSI